MGRTLIEVLYTCSKSIITNFLGSTELSLLCVPFNLNESFYQILFQIPHETATFYNQSFTRLDISVDMESEMWDYWISFILMAFFSDAIKKSSLFVAF